MGDLLGHAVRSGVVDDVAAAGEGIETMLSLGMVLPGTLLFVALAAAHLAAILFPSTLRRLDFAPDDDSTGGPQHIARPLASTLFRCHRGWGISMMICGS